jgi:hypothetical protein
MPTDSKPSDPSAAEKQIQSSRTATAVLIGLLVGIAVWSATHRGGMLTYILLIAALLIGRRHANAVAALKRTKDTQPSESTP